MNTAKKIIIIILLSTAPYLSNAQEKDVKYTLTMSINDKLVSTDSFSSKKPPNAPLPKPVLASFNSDKIDLQIEFSLPKSMENISFACNYGMQTESGYERFNYRKSTNNSSIAKGSSKGLYICRFVDITSHYNSSKVVSPIDKNETYLFEIWVEELGKNWTYFSIIANENSEWPNKSQRITKDD